MINELKTQALLTVHEYLRYQDISFTPASLRTAALLILYKERLVLKQLDNIRRMRLWLLIQ